MARIVSQDGRLNMPYEYTIVYIEGCAVMANTVDSPFGKLMAVYSTEELAIKAVEEMTKTLFAFDVFQFKQEENPM